MVVLKEEMAFYSELVKESGFDAVLSPQPNQYYSSEPTAPPWCVIRTRWGDIFFGPRRRVYNIDWANIAATYPKVAEEIRPMDLFPQENVTKLSFGIHAWGRAKAVEYLRVLHDKLEKKGERVYSFLSQEAS